MSPKIVVVTAGGPHPWIIANALIERFGPIDVILEEGEPRRAMIRRRVRRFGYINAAGQTAMMIWTVIAKRLLKRRIARIVDDNGLKPGPQPGQSVIGVSSVNAPGFQDAVARLKPDLLFLVGCRMMKAGMLADMPCPVVNYHAGINPKYRGMNGGYWALAGGDAENFGGTVHLVDAGVDTGGTLRQVRGKPAPNDNFMTYAFRQAAMSREICIAAAEDALAGRLAPVASDLPSKQWYHPTIWNYFWTGITRGVW
ncbi:formyl transferase [Arvimicrobium flavum]|uniref:formyl transferase n=1 Tax=Arvimicrobium flavum TaxID=3393320 RepID=UPI00237AA728|nr:formyl transferase [Mesorhizobium shangrilense]